MNYNTKYVVRLTEEERGQLEGLLNRGRVAAGKRRRAQILLKADAGSEGSGPTDEQVAKALDVGRVTVHRVRQAYVEQGLKEAVERKKPLRHRRRKLDGEQEAQLVALACSPPPRGRARWTLRLLADRLVELEVVDSISKDAVRETLKKNGLKPWLKEEWVLPKAPDAEFVCAMEDVLDVYKRPYDPKRPVVCVDEATKQLVADITPPIPMEPGQPARQDYEYERRGTANLFMEFEPLRGQRHVKVTDQRTNHDFALVLRDLSDVYYPDAETILLVIDNLNTHKLSVLYQAFPPEEARRLHRRFEVHHTPKHASWLNMAECELSALSRQCLDRRIDDRALLEEEVRCWEAPRNEAEVIVDWQFTTEDARIKLKRLYPVLVPVKQSQTDH